MPALNLPRALIISLCLAALSSCTVVGDDYRIPDEAVLKQEKASAPFVSAQKPAYTQDNLPQDWWRLYDQETLNVLIDKALAANTDLRVASANLKRAKALLDEARSMTDPYFDVAAAAAYGRNATRHGTHRDSSHWFYDAGVGMSYQLDMFGKIARAIESASADAEAVLAAHDLTRITVIADTTRAWLDICATGHQIEVASRSVDLQKNVVDTTERLLYGGRATSLDVARSRAQLEHLRATIPPLIAQRHVAMFQLTVLTGEVPDSLPESVAQCKAIPKLSQPVPVGDGALLLSRRPDIRQAERALAAATARIGVATADLYPDISLGIGLGRTGTLSHFGSNNAFRFSAGPLISWTIPATGPAHARIRQAEAETEAALANFDGVVLNALKEAESALTIYARELDRNAALRRARDMSALASRQAHQLYDYGRTDFLTTLDADRTLAEFESQLALSEAQLARYQISLFLALGGGWNSGEEREHRETQTE
jgi:NodT family efflux transporter outer membrane factor (OMF) lipoprotein